MQVNRRDGVCRSCGGKLTIIDADDATMTVQCECGEQYVVETDAFGDGAMTYWPNFLAQRLQGGRDE